NEALLMPCSRHSSGTGVPASACFRIAMIWLSVNRDFFIEFPCCENSTSDHCGFVGGLPMDMRAGPDTALARVVKDFGAARPHHAYVFANRRANRLKILVHDGLGVWLAARCLNQGRFVWPR